jgi:hypothetical protein
MNEKIDVINECQEIQLKRVELGSFNDFDGPLVAKSLRANKHLWKSFLFGRFGNRFCYMPLIELRDLADNYINVDTIMMLAPIEGVKEIEDLATSEWKVDEFGYNYYEERIPEQSRLIRPEKSPTFKAVGTAPCSNEKDVWGNLGGELEDGMALIRMWWD